MSEDDETLFAICARQAILAEYRDAQAFRARLPPQMCDTVERLAREFAQLLNVVGEFVGVDALAKCLKIGSETREICVRETILALETRLDRSDFFDVCARFCFEEETERIFALLNDDESYALLSRHAIVKCRAIELRHGSGWRDYLERRQDAGMARGEALPARRGRQRQAEVVHYYRPVPEIYYEKVALDCAMSGFLSAFERSLEKIESLEDVTLPHCVLEAIKHGQYHIANHVASCDNYDKAFYMVFPDGRVPPTFFAALLDGDLVREGDRIAVELLNYLPKYDVERLRREMAKDAAIARSGALLKFDSMCSEVLHQREYPCDVD